MDTASSEIIVTVEEAPEGGFTARGIRHDIFTEADTLDELRDAAREAERHHVEEAAPPRPIRLRLLREEALTRSL